MVRWPETQEIRAMQKNQQELYKQITRHFFEQAWSKTNFDGLDELIDSQALFHMRDQTVPMGADGSSTATRFSRWLLTVT
jgi:hypothetical protein